ncbi:MAG: FeoB-associated Cys-rich membrane protein, partial [Campylobacter sp.]|nr:FeoB-associated Cys-rich membrane protein [Campylobacter sp.]
MGDFCCALAVRDSLDCGVYYQASMPCFWDLAMIDIILIALLVFGVLLAVLNIIRKRKYGSCCSGGCGGCSFGDS